MVLPSMMAPPSSAALAAPSAAADAGRASPAPSVSPRQSKHQVHRMTSRLEAGITDMAAKNAPPAPVRNDALHMALERRMKANGGFKMAAQTISAARKMAADIEVDWKD